MFLSMNEVGLWIWTLICLSILLSILKYTMMPQMGFPTIYSLTKVKVFALGANHVASHGITKLSNSASPETSIVLVLYILIWITTVNFKPVVLFLKIMTCMCSRSSLMLFGITCKAIPLCHKNVFNTSRKTLSSSSLSSKDL